MEGVSGSSWTVKAAGWAGLGNCAPERCPETRRHQQAHPGVVEPGRIACRSTRTRHRLSGTLLAKEAASATFARSLSRLPLELAILARAARCRRGVGCDGTREAGNGSWRTNRARRTGWARDALAVARHEGESGVSMCASRAGLWSGRALHAERPVRTIEARCVAK